MKLTDLKPGDTIRLDGGFTCHAGGEAVVKSDDTGNLYFDCDDGQHLLDGQIGPDGELIGVDPA